MCSQPFRSLIIWFHLGQQWDPHLKRGTGRWWSLGLFPVSHNLLISCQVAVSPRVPIFDEECTLCKSVCAPLLFHWLSCRFSEGMISVRTINAFRNGTTRRDQCRFGNGTFRFPELARGYLIPSSRGNAFPMLKRTYLLDRVYRSGDGLKWWVGLSKA